MRIYNIKNIFDNGDFVSIGTKNAIIHLPPTNNDNKPHVKHSIIVKQQGGQFDVVIDFEQG